MRSTHRRDKMEKEIIPILFLNTSTGGSIELNCKFVHYVGRKWLNLIQHNRTLNYVNNRGKRNAGQNKRQTTGLNPLNVEYFSVFICLFLFLVLLLEHSLRLPEDMKQVDTPWLTATSHSVVLCSKRWFYVCDCTTISFHCETVRFFLGSFHGAQHITKMFGRAKIKWIWCKYSKHKHNHGTNMRFTNKCGEHNNIETENIF